MNNVNLHIVLHEPEIPGNAGSIGRTCLALNAELILIKPYGFSLDEKSVRRAGLDYWKHVNLVKFDSWEHFLQERKPLNSDLFFLETKAPQLVFNAPFKNHSYLIFGSETKGLPAKILKNHEQNIYELPMNSEHIRSINLSNAATAVAYIAYGKILQQI